MPVTRKAKAMRTTEETHSAEDLRNLYERDYYGWIQRNVRAIREGRVEEVDWPNVAEELEGMAKSEKRALRSQIARLMAHLLKWSYQPQRRRLGQNSWRATIQDARESVRELIDENPSLKPLLPELLSAGYRKAVRLVVAETNLPERAFPAACPWTFDQMIDEEFWPSAG